MPAARLNGLEAQYQQVGGGPDIILVHGLGANLAFWYFSIVPLLRADMRVTTYDLRGHGRSSMPPSGYTSAEMAGDLRALMDGLRIERAHVVGHSFGGLVALQAAALMPDRVASLTVADTRIPALQPTLRIGDWASGAEWVQSVQQMGVTLEPEQALDHHLLERLARVSEQFHESAHAYSPEIPFSRSSRVARGAKRWLELLASTTARRDFDDPAGLSVERLRLLQVPVRAIYGEYSACLESGRLLSELIRGCGLVIVPGVGHYHPVRKPDFTAACVREMVLSGSARSVSPMDTSS